MKNQKISFILNDLLIEEVLDSGSLIVDYLREKAKLKGTKTACREGDCGACMVLLGESKNDRMVYKAVTSCLLAVGEVANKHLVTIEGLNLTEKIKNSSQAKLNFIQQMIVDNGATQCGFCTPGLVISLTGFLLNCEENLQEEDIYTFIESNVCRCTGYGSIARSAKSLYEKVSQELINKNKIAQRPQGSYFNERIEKLIQMKVLPEYFGDMFDRIEKLKSSFEESGENTCFVAGGTDLFLHQEEKLLDRQLIFLSKKKELSFIRLEGESLLIGSSITTEELKNSKLIDKIIPGLSQNIKKISSLSIRQQATIGGNIVNASPIGDLSIIFLALDAGVELSLKGKLREVSLKDFFLDYKKLDLKEGELLRSFKIPIKKNLKFNFEKVSKREYLDIASVNTALSLVLSHQPVEPLGPVSSDAPVVKTDIFIQEVGLSAGGLGPTPQYLRKSSEFLKGQKLSIKIIKDVVQIADSEISPISDLRGSERYKRKLLTHLIYAHFISLFPDCHFEEDLL